MRILIAVAAAAALGLLFIFRPVHPPAAAERGWQKAPRDVDDAALSRRPPSPQPGVDQASSGDAALGARHGARASSTMVYVAGEVVHPGVYAIAADARVAEAVSRAGGLRPSADPTAVNLAAHVADGDEILVVAKGTAIPKRAHHRRASGRHRRSAHRARAVPDETSAQVDINRADAATLATVPGIGAGLAARIVAFREANGPFDSADELLDVSGITDRRLDALLPYVVTR